jgi:hypothetical protein
MASSDYPKPSDARLTQEQKVLIDQLSDKAVKKFLDRVHDKEYEKITDISPSGVVTLELGRCRAYSGRQRLS